MTKDLAFASLAELARGLRAGEFTSVELTQLYLDRIARFDGRLHAYVSVAAEAALLQAQAADLQRQAGLPLPTLHGLPIAVKDLCDIEGQITTFGSQAWRNRRSNVTSTVVRRLLDNGMIVLGKTHLVEFAFGGWGTNPLMGTPHNPWDLQTPRAPGGSSSGSGVAVAGGLAPAAIGSDTGGSVRAPAAFNGITGLKTTSGLISLYGSLALAPSLDTIGPMTRSAEDAGLLTAALAGPDPQDPTTLGRPPFRFMPRAPAPGRAWRVAMIAPDAYPWPLEPAVQRAFDAAASTLRALGADVRTVALPFDFADLMRRVGSMIAIEAYHEHAGHIEMPNDDIGPWVRKRILGGRADAHAYQALLAHRRETIARFNDWMRAYDVLLTPTLPIEACPVADIDEEVTPVGAFNRGVNYLDACALSLPAGFSEKGLPLGVQLIAPGWHENVVLELGQAFQQATDWHRRLPPGLA